GARVQCAGRDLRERGAPQARGRRFRGDGRARGRPGEDARDPRPEAVHAAVSFDVLVALVAALAGGVAAVSGFGIGSLLTPLLAAHFGTRTAVAAVSIPHVVGTAVRFVTLRPHVDGPTFRRFGILSAAGGLLGALANARVKSPVLSVVLGGLLVFAGV